MRPASPVSLRQIALRIVTIVLMLASIQCSDSDSGRATSPTTSTRVITLSGNLALGDVTVGTTRSTTLTITNSGSAALAVTSISVSPGISSLVNLSWTSGQIAPGSAQTVTINFTPTLAGAYSGTLTVNSDRTDGVNSIALNAVGLINAPFAGGWQGNYLIDQCIGSGSAEDLVCSRNRGLYPVGTPLPIGINLSQTGNLVSGTFSLGAATGPVNGVVTNGVLSLQGTGASGPISVTITSWNTRVNGNVMEGNITYAITVIGATGPATVVTRLGRVTTSF
jgi:hypothetical protein